MLIINEKIKFMLSCEYSSNLNDTSLIYHDNKMAITEYLIYLMKTIQNRYEIVYENPEQVLSLLFQYIEDVKKLNSNIIKDLLFSKDKIKIELAINLWKNI
jgi:hypothetical protein